MDTLWTGNGTYRRASYQSEADLEAAIVQVRAELFGANRIYLDVKKKIGAKGGKQNIPDGYLIDLNGQMPRLYVVENELASHDPLRHIAVQILEFSLAFESAPLSVRSILFQSLEAEPEAKAKCEQYLATHGCRNLDHFLDELVHKTPFAALVIIDELPDSLEAVLINRFRFGVEVLELARYEGKHGERVFRFEPFLADIIDDIQQNGPGGGPLGHCAMMPVRFLGNDGRSIHAAVLAATLNGKDEALERSHGPETIAPEQRDRIQAMQQLFASWMAEEPQYDRHTWAELERGLEEDPFTLRSVPDDLDDTG